MSGVWNFYNRSRRNDKGYAAIDGLRYWIEDFSEYTERDQLRIVRTAIERNGWSWDDEIWAVPEGTGMTYVYSGQRLWVC